MPLRSLHKMLGLLLGLAMLCSCAPKTDPTVSLQTQLANSKAAIALSNCSTDVAQAPFFYDYETSNDTVQIPFYSADNVPVLTIEGTAAEDVKIEFATPYEGGYRPFDYLEPLDKIDYVLSVSENGALQYRMDTVYYYYITVTTATGSDSFILYCVRETG